MEGIVSAVSQFGALGLLIVMGVGFWKMDRRLLRIEFALGLNGVAARAMEQPRKKEGAA